MSAACQGDGFGADLTTDRESRDSGNFAGLYPPVYYFAMSLFAGDDLQSSALVMRAVNALFFVGLVTAVFFLLPVRRRPTLLIALAVTLVPLGMTLIPSNNPSGWAILSAGTLWIALLGYFETTGIRRALLGVVAAVATLVGAGARADSALYAGVAILVVVALTARRGRDYLILAILPFTLSLIAAAAFLGSSQSSAIGTGLTAEVQGNSTYELIVQNFLELPALLTGGLGTWNLGWFDTALPAIVPFAACAALGGAILIGIASPGRRKSWAAFAVLALVVSVPMYLLYKSDALVGTQVQPRYILPLIVLLVGIVLLESPGRPLSATRGQVFALAGGIVVANAVSLHATMRRYVTGTGVTGGNLDSGAEWWWDIPISPMTVWAVGSVAFAASVFLLSLMWLARARTTQAEDWAQPVLR